MIKEINTRVKTERHGKGTVIGFERFAVTGKQLPDSLTFIYGLGRVVVRLDDPSLWACSYDENDQLRHPYFRQSELKEVDDEIL